MVSVPPACTVPAMHAAAIAPASSVARGMRLWAWFRCSFGAVSVRDVLTGDVRRIGRLQVAGYDRHMNGLRLAVGFFAALAASAAIAAPNSCLPVVEQAWIRAAPPTAQVYAAYAKLYEPCGKAV